MTSKETKSRVDSETRATKDDHIALRLWLRLFTCSNLVEGHLRSQLRIDFESTLPRFDLLSQLEREPEGLTMGVLSDRMMVSGGNVTALVNQLTKSGLVSRVAHPNSGRTFIVKLTAKGKKHFDTMAKSHESWVIDMFDGLSGAEIKTLMKGLAKLKQSVAQHRTNDA